MSKIFIEESTLTAIGDAIRGKEGTTELVPVTDMATRITAIQSGGADLPEEAFNITGSMYYKFHGGGWDWFIRDYGSRVKTSNIDRLDYAFSSSLVTKIPFEINCNPDYTVSLNAIFSSCSQLTQIPKINNCKPDNIARMFYGCFNIRQIPDEIADWFDWSYGDTSTSRYSFNNESMFDSCYSLRELPYEILKHGNPYANYSICLYYCGFQSCFSLNEIVNLPIPHTNSEWASNAFSRTFRNCYRLKNMTFALNPETNAPYVVNWRNQTIDLVNNVGYAYWGDVWSLASGAYNTGITYDDAVTDDATYQAKKDSPNWYTEFPAYSRYNHDSAVATINSLPDTSAYLTSMGGTNTIQFRGDSGASTDGGAISNLTEEEIAVATAKGWTVTIS